MSLIESATLRLEPLSAAHAEEMFEPMSAAGIYQYIPGRPAEADLIRTAKSSPMTACSACRDPTSFQLAS
jgi:hypothetical protein